MATFVYKPVQVEAFKIKEVKPFEEASVTGQPLVGVTVVLDNGETKVCDHAMISRYTPVVGDYFVIQPDGYEYLNPKDVFERKFDLASDVKIKSDLDKFIELYASFGIELKEEKIKKGSRITISDDETIFSVDNKFDGYPGFYTTIDFDSEGKFIKQGFWE